MSNNLLDSCLDSGGVDIVDNYVRALAAETQSDGLPDTMRGPCHDHNFVAKASLHLNHLVSSFLLIAYCQGYIPNSVGTGGWVEALCLSSLPHNPHALFYKNQAIRMATRTGTRPPHPLFPSPCPYR